MKWVSAITSARAASDAVDELERDIRATLQEAIDLAFLFVSPYFKNDYDTLSSRVSEQLGCRLLVGCSASGVIGGTREIERRPAISLVAASLPGVNIQPFHKDQSDLPDLDASPKKWEACFGISTPDPSCMVLLADPFTLDVEKVLQGLDYAYPRSVKIGGLASGAEGTGQGALFLKGQRFRSGLVGVGLSGKIAMDTLVAHGCKPIGKPFSMTRCNNNLIVEINHQKSIDVLRDLFADLSESDQSQMQSSLFIGLATTPFEEDVKNSDFLIRPLVGLDSKTGALAVGAIPREGQIGQFYMRDKEASAEALKWSLGAYQRKHGSPSALGALLFACTGRGVHFYGEPDFDTSLFHTQMGHVPLGGFFCGGEIGALGSTTFLHGYTSCFGIFRSPE